MDANLVIHLVAGVASDTVRDLWARWRDEYLAFAAPTLLPYEVTNALHLYRRTGVLSEAAAREAQQTALDLPIELHGDAGLHRAALAVALRFALPAAYDAHYLALAERLGLDFWTADQRLARAVQLALPWVHLAR